MTAPATPGLKGAMAWCAFFLGVDVILIGAPMFAAFAVFVLLFRLLPRVLLALRRRDLLVHRGAVAAMTAAAALVDVVAFNAYESIARSRVLEVAAALDRHQQRHGAYPARLAELVPNELARIPPAKSGLVVMGDILFLRVDNRPALMYVSVPPFGRRIYDLATREWSMMD